MLNRDIIALSGAIFIFGLINLKRGDLRGLQPRKKCAKALSFHIASKNLLLGDKMKKKTLSSREKKIVQVLLEITKVANSSPNSNHSKNTRTVLKKNNKNVYAYQFTDLGVTIFEKEDKNG